MKVLGIETATSLCGVGLAGDEGFVADYKLLRGYIHAEHLPVAVERVLMDAGIPADEVDGIAVSIGPGSFTGLRIGLGLAKGLAFGLDKPLLAVPTMDGLVSQVPDVCEWACVMLVARRGEVYQGLYRWENGSWKLAGDYDVIPEDTIGDRLPEGEILFLGEGAICHRGIIQKKVKGARFMTSVQSLPSGYSVAEKGRELLQTGQTVDIDTLVPLYLKRFQGVA